jgi:hypothetical protein
MNFDQTDEFKKELKRLQKKWRSLPNDLNDAQKLIEDLYVTQDGDDKLIEYRTAFFNGKRAAILSSLDDGREVVKMRLDCASLVGSDKMRLVFVAIRSEDTILFIELYTKNEKAREDVNRIKRYL